MSDKRMMDRAQENTGHLVRMAVEQTKNRIRERVQEQARIIAEEETAKLFADLNFDLNINRDLSGMTGVEMQVNLIVTKVGKKSGEE